jgi:hypothetical protein
MRSVTFQINESTDANYYLNNRHIKQDMRQRNGWVDKYLSKYLQCTTEPEISSSYITVCISVLCNGNESFLELSSIA